MKHRFNFGNVTRCFTAILLFSGCKDGFWTKDRIDPDCPEVASISPVAAPANAVVSILGNNFATDSPALYEVLIGNKPVDSLEVPDDHTMTFKVPPGIGTGVVTVKLKDGCEADIKPSFTYLLTATNVIRIAGTFGQSGSNTCQTCLDTPTGIVVDEAGILWVADKLNHVVRQIGVGGAVTTIGTFRIPDCEVNTVPAGFQPHFNQPVDLAISSTGGLIIAEKQNFTLRKRNTNGSVARYAGQCGVSEFVDGNCSVSQLGSPTSIAQDGRITYFVDSGNIRKADATNDDSCPLVSPVVNIGGGVTFALAIEVSHALHTLGPIFITDKQEKIIKSISETGQVTNLASVGVNFGIPSALAMDSQGNIFVADEEKNQIFVVYTSGIGALLAGTGAEGITDNRPGLEVQFKKPAGIAVDPKNDKILYVSDSKNHVIRRIMLQ